MRYEQAITNRPVGLVLSRDKWLRVPPYSYLTEAIASVPSGLPAVSAHHRATWGRRGQHATLTKEDLEADDWVAVSFDQIVGSTGADDENILRARMLAIRKLGLAPGMPTSGIILALVDRVTELEANAAREVHEPQGRRDW